MNLYEFIQMTRPPHPCVECGDDAWLRMGNSLQWRCGGCGGKVCFDYPVTRAGTRSVREYIWLQAAA